MVTRSEISTFRDRDHPLRLVVDSWAHRAAGAARQLEVTAREEHQEDQKRLHELRKLRTARLGATDKTRRNAARSGNRE